MGSDAGWDFDRVLSCDVHAFNFNHDQSIAAKKVQKALTALNPAPFQSSCNRLISSSDKVFSMLMDGSVLLVIADVAIFGEGMGQDPLSSTAVLLDSMSTGMAGRSFSLSKTKLMTGIYFCVPQVDCKGVRRKREEVRSFQ